VNSKNINKILLNGVVTNNIGTASQDMKQEKIYIGITTSSCQAFKCKQTKFALHDKTKLPQPPSAFLKL
jgi:hypothetical protein